MKKYLRLVWYIILALANSYYVVVDYYNHRYVLLVLNAIAAPLMFYWAIRESIRINKTAVEN